MLLALLRRIPEHDATARRGEWNRTRPHTPRLLRGSTVGLIGYGHIGRLVARRLEGFDVELLVSDPALAGSESPRSVELDELLARADVVSLHTPLVPATRHLIDQRALRLMQPHAVLVNTSRGGVVDEAALIEALTDGTIAGAALDVFEVEPPPVDSPLLAMPNVVISPHVGGLSTKSVDVMSRMATASVIDVIEGRIPEGLVNRAILD
jgi:phosphoglycerate dehydrogenase-like enzyme